MGLAEFVLVPEEPPFRLLQPLPKPTQVSAQGMTGELFTGNLEDNPGHALHESWTQLLNVSHLYIISRDFPHLLETSIT